MTCGKPAGECQKTMESDTGLPVLMSRGYLFPKTGSLDGNNGEFLDTAGAGVGAAKESLSSPKTAVDISRFSFSDGGYADLREYDTDDILSDLESCWDIADRIGGSQKDDALIQQFVYVLWVRDVLPKKYDVFTFSGEHPPRFVRVD